MNDVVKEALREIISQFLRDTKNSRQEWRQDISLKEGGELIEREPTLQEFINWIH